MKKCLIIFTLALFLTGCTASKNEEVSYETFSDTATKEADTHLTASDATLEENSKNTTSNSSVREEPAHQYFCDKFLLTVDEKQFDLTTIVPDLSSVSELYPITDDQLYILGRIDETYNALMVYDFVKEEFIFSEQGTTMCWVQNKFDTIRYLKDNIVYDFNGNIIYQPESSKIISMIEYVVEDFKITLVNSDYQNEEELWLE